MTSSVHNQRIPDFPPALPKKQRVLYTYTFLGFLSNAVAHANTDNIKLAVKNWKILKQKDIPLPEYIDRLFSRLDTEQLTLEDFARVCGQHALEIQEACIVDRPEVARTLDF